MALAAARAASQALDDGGGGHRAARAHGDQRRARAAPLEFVQRGGEQPGAGAAHRVAEGDRAAVDVDPAGSGRVTASQDSATDANASLTSNRSMSLIVMPLRLQHPFCRLGPGRRGGGPSSAPTRHCAPIRSRAAGPGDRAQSLVGHRSSRAPRRRRSATTCLPCAGSCSTTGLSRSRRRPRLVSRSPSSRSTTRVSPSAGRRRQDRRLDRHDLPVEPALRPGGLGQGLGPQPERVDVRAGQPAPLARCARRRRTGSAGRCPTRRAGASRRPSRAAVPSGTRLIASTPQAIPTPIASGRDQPGHQVRGLLRRTALGVERQAAGLLAAARRAARRSW